MKINKWKIIIQRQLNILSTLTNILPDGMSLYEKINSVADTYMKKGRKIERIIQIRDNESRLKKEIDR